MKAALALDLLTEAASFCRKGLEQDHSNEELNKLLSEVDAKLREQDRQRGMVAQAITKAKVSFCHDLHCYTNIGIQIYGSLSGY